MCSIGGFISSKPISKTSADALITAMLYYGMERGEQSAGVYMNNTLLKKAMNPFELSQTKEFDDLFLTSPSYALVHTRHPTSGGTGDKQAQPFMAGDTVTVHNGWFNNIHEIKGKWEIKKKSGVDSELVTQFIHSYGIKKLPEFLKSVSGSAAFGILYKGELYLMRDGNPTSYTTLDFGKTKVFAFASTPRMLSNALRHAWLIPGDHKIKETKEGVLYHATPDGVTGMSPKVFTKMTDWSQYRGRRFPGHSHMYKQAYGQDDLTDFSTFSEFDRKELETLRAELGDSADLILSAEGIDLENPEEAQATEQFDDLRYFHPDRESDKKD